MTMRLHTDVWQQSWKSSFLSIMMDTVTLSGGPPPHKKGGWTRNQSWLRSSRSSDSYSACCHGIISVFYILILSWDKRQSIMFPTQSTLLDKLSTSLVPASLSYLTCAMCNTNSSLLGLLWLQHLITAPCVIQTPPLTMCLLHPLWLHRLRNWNLIAPCVNKLPPLQHI